MAKKKGVVLTFVEIFRDPTLRRKEHAAATEALRRFYPKAKRVGLYRTADGQLGFVADIGGLPRSLTRWKRAVERAVEGSLRSRRKR